MLDGRFETVLRGRGERKQLLETVKAPGVVDLKVAVQLEQFKEKAVGEKVKSWREKKIHGEFLRQLEEEGIDINGTWNWLKKS